MSNNFNALLNAAAVATTQPIPAVFAAAGARAAAVQGNAAAVHGAAAFGAANVAVADVPGNVPGNVPAASGSGTTRVKRLSRQPSFVVPPSGDVAPGSSAQANSGAAAVNVPPVFPPGLAVPAPAPAGSGSGTTRVKRLSRQPSFVAAPSGDVAPVASGSNAHANSGTVVVVNGQPVFPPGLAVPAPTNFGAATANDQPVPPDYNPKLNKGQDHSARPRANVDQPFARHRSARQPREGANMGSYPGLPIVLPDNLWDLNPIDPLDPPNLPPGAPTVAAIKARFKATLNDYRKHACRASGAAPLTKSNRRSKSHAMTRDEWQDLYRWIKHRGGPESELYEAEARCAVNKYEQLRLLEALREEENKKPEAHQHHWQTGAEIAAELEDARKLVGREVSHAAAAFLPKAPPPAAAPTHPPPPAPTASRSIWSVVANAVTGLLKRKRSADDDAQPAQPQTHDSSEERSAKRARVEEERKRQPRSKHLRHQHMADPPRKVKGVYAETHPDYLSYYDEAAFSAPVFTSDAAMQTDSAPLSPPVASLSRQPLKAPLSRSSSFTDSEADVDGTSRLPSKMPLLSTSTSTDSEVDTAGPSTATTAGPTRTSKRRKVRFAPYKSIARPPRLASPPPPHMDGVEPDPEEEAQRKADEEFFAGSAISHDYSTSTVPFPTVVDEPVADESDIPANSTDPTLRHVWTQPAARYVTYQEAGTQYEDPSVERYQEAGTQYEDPSVELYQEAGTQYEDSSVEPTSPDAASGQKRRRGTRAGRQVQERRRGALKTAATATEVNEKVELM
ncbi:hypothetical protein AURDEDRAFT_181465 [Auricularia subglabra TFB-10046 SS5]|nr:hypothetical protein AURDEDRAFT_181465 [Auricularia subglabra TFB-10046 SS5]